MKRKSAILGALCMATVCGSIGVASMQNVSTDASGNYVIEAVTGNENGFVTETEWAALDSVALSGSNVGTVKVATIGTRLYVRMDVVDSTAVTGTDRIAYALSVGSFSVSEQGHYDGAVGKTMWITAADGTNRIAEATYQSRNEETSTYTTYFGYDLGENYVEGATVTASFTHQDTTDTGGGWQSGVTSTWSGTMYLGVDPTATPDEPEVVVNEKVISAAASNANGHVSEEAWEIVTAHALSEGNGTVKLATVDTRLYFRMEVTDTTYYMNADKIEWSISVGSFTASVYGNYSGAWLVGTSPNIQMEQSYDETNTKYIATMAYDLGSNYVEGAAVSFSILHNDATTAEMAWGGGVNSTYSDTLYLGAEPADVTNVSISTDAEIALNFYCDLADIVTTDATAKVVFTKSEVIKEIAVSDLTAQSDGSYKLSYDVPAKDYMKTVNLSVVYAGGTIDCATYSVEQYITDLNAMTDEKYKAAQDFAAKLQAYCETARVYFDVPTTATATDDLTVDLSGYAYRVEKTDETDETVTLYGASLVLEAKTTICVYFQTTVEDVTTLNENAKQVADGIYVVEVENIDAASLDTPYTITIGNVEVYYSGLSYVYSVLNSNNSSVALQNVVKALYAYNAQANEYFGR